MRLQHDGREVGSMQAAAGKCDSVPLLRRSKVKAQSPQCMPHLQYTYIPWLVRALREGATTAALGLTSRGASMQT
jgi:hypothetical protein